MNAHLISLLIIMAKSTAVYIFIVFAIRLFGKKELAQLSVVDLVFILLISNAVQNAMVGDDNSLPGGLAAASGLFIVNYVFKWLLKYFPGFSRFIQGSEIMLVYHGKMIAENMNKALITKEELEASVREHGVKDIKEVNLAILEMDGNISICSNDFTHRTTRRRKAHRVISKTT
jgi:uncharacterized membrane protein YcaP (DUF421 family)